MFSNVSGSTRVSWTSGSVTELNIASAKGDQGCTAAGSSHSLPCPTLPSSNHAPIFQHLHHHVDVEHTHRTTAPFYLPLFMHVAIAWNRAPFFFLFMTQEKKKSNKMPQGFFCLFVLFLYITICFKVISIPGETVSNSSFSISWLLFCHYLPPPHEHGTDKLLSQTMCLYLFWFFSCTLFLPRSWYMCLTGQTIPWSTFY